MELDRPGIDPAELSLHLKAGRLKTSGEPDAAVARWQRFLETHPDSPLLEEVKGALGRTLIETALSAGSRKQAEQYLVLAAADGDRFAAFAVELFRAIADLGIEGGTEIASERLTKAFLNWERDTVLEEPGTALAEDVASIRRLVFRPREVKLVPEKYQPERRPRYSVVTPEIDLAFPDGGKQTLTLRHDFPEVKGVLYFTREELSFITTIIDGFGGKERTRPQWIMAIPQPDGIAKTISKLLNQFIQLTPGHWGGWHVSSYPMLYTLTFHDAERTRATVEFRVRYRGREASLEKGESGWELGEVKSTWME
jgi:hypothetical protein